MGLIVSLSAAGRSQTPAIHSGTCFWTTASLWTIPLSSLPSRVPCSPDACLVRPSNSWICSAVLSLLRHNPSKEADHRNSFQQIMAHGTFSASAESREGSARSSSLRRLPACRRNRFNLSARHHALMTLSSPHASLSCSTTNIAYVHFYSDLLFRFINFFPFRCAEIHSRHD